MAQEFNISNINPYPGEKVYLTCSSPSNRMMLYMKTQTTNEFTNISYSFSDRGFYCKLFSIESRYQSPVCSTPSEYQMSVLMENVTPADSGEYFCGLYRDDGHVIKASNRSLRVFGMFA